MRFGALVKVVSNGINSGTFYTEPSAVLQKEKEGRKAILLFSRKDRRKGFDIARIVVGKLAGLTAVPFEVWTVGEPSAGMFPAICHRDFGYANEDILRKLFSSADVFLYPSRHEGFPLMVLEAFACRCPVVTTEAVPYAKHEENALVGRIEDPGSLAQYIRMLIESDSLRQKIVDQAFLYATENTIQKSNLLFESVLRNLCLTKKIGPEAR
jgi:glycosyltransferase involved in cell wall biosynthesis